jgi:hypothetical protein
MLTELLPINDHIPACHGNVLASRWLARDYSGFRASCHNIFALSPFVYKKVQQTLLFGIILFKHDRLRVFYLDFFILKKIHVYTCTPITAASLPFVRYLLALPRTSMAF